MVFSEFIFRTMKVNKNSIKKEKKKKLTCAFPVALSSPASKLLVYPFNHCLQFFSEEFKFILYNSYIIWATYMRHVVLQFSLTVLAGLGVLFDRL